MNVFWLATIRKKAGAVRPRMKTTVVSKDPIISATPKTLTFLQIERGAMAAWINERNKDHATI